MNKKIHPEYRKFFLALDGDGVDWALIKDTKMLLSKGYDNEIDIIVKSRRKLTKIAKKLRWHSSTLNCVNSHVIFWKFDKDIKSLRLDFHVNRVLATSAPWIKAKHILTNKIIVSGIKSTSPTHELVILMIASLRGRKLKEYRIKRVKELEKYVVEASVICKDHLTKKQFVNVYNRYINGKSTKWPLVKRLGFFGMINLRLRELKIFFARLFRPASLVSVIGKNNSKVISSLKNKLCLSKIKARYVKVDNLFDNIKIIYLRWTCDIVFINIEKPNSIIYNINKIKERSVLKITNKLIKKIYP